MVDDRQLSFLENFERLLFALTLLRLLVCDEGLEGDLSFVLSIVPSYLVQVTKACWRDSSCIAAHTEPPLDLRTISKLKPRHEVYLESLIHGVPSVGVLHPPERLR